MSDQSYAAHFIVSQTPEEVFAAVNNVRGWWSGEIEGDTGKLGAEFTYRVPDVHYCRMKVTDLVRDQRVVWRVLDSDIDYSTVKTEWNNTEVRFDISEKDGQTEVRFTHMGLVPDYECYDSCSYAWGMYLNESLRKLIATGEPQPSPFAPGGPSPSAGLRG
jgi:Activator of Hsp90 ATPase homolog 1-like protein